MWLHRICECVWFSRFLSDCVTSLYIQGPSNPPIVITMDQADDLILSAEDGLRNFVRDVDNTHLDGLGCDPLLVSCAPLPTDPQPDRLYFYFDGALTTPDGALAAPNGAFDDAPFVPIMKLYQILIKISIKFNEKTSFSLKSIFVCKSF